MFLSRSIQQTAPDEDGGGVVNHSLPPIASSTITQPRSVAKRCATITWACNVT